MPDPMPSRPSLWRDPRAATTIEYALLASLTAIAAFAALMAFGGSITDLYTAIIDAILKAVPPKS